MSNREIRKDHYWYPDPSVPSKTPKLFLASSHASVLNQGKSSVKKKQTNKKKNRNNDGTKKAGHNWPFKCLGGKAETEK